MYFEYGYDSCRAQTMEPTLPQILQTVMWKYEPTWHREARRPTSSNFGKLMNLKAGWSKNAAYYQQLADNGDKSFWYKNADEEYVCREWTQADVDALYATWKEQLALIRQGYQFTKAFEAADGGSLVGGFLSEE